jgi:hypothetical protein
VPPIIGLAYRVLPGAHEQSRTADLILTKNVLCLLSYVGLPSRLRTLLQTIYLLNSKRLGSAGAPVDRTSVVFFRLAKCIPYTANGKLEHAARGTHRILWAEKDSNLRRAKPDWFTASSDWPLRHLPLEPTGGFEPSTSCLQNSCSATELRRRTKQTLRVLFVRYKSPATLFQRGFRRDATNYTAHVEACQADFRACKSLVANGLHEAEHATFSSPPGPGGRSSPGACWRVSRDWWLCV